jgi:hypothetical protein
VVRDARISHPWGGALGVPRDSRTRVGVDLERGFAWIGGYVGRRALLAHARDRGTGVRERRRVAA